MRQSIPRPDRTIGAAHLVDLLDRSTARDPQTPSYRACADALRSALLSGALPTRSRLPSERDLANALGVSRTTVTAAYDLLRQDGYLISRQGSGTVTRLPAGANRAPSFGDRVDGRLLDLTKAMPAAPPELTAAFAGAIGDLRHHLGGGGLEPLGVPTLREELADWYTNRGVPTNPRQIMVTSGAQQGLALILGGINRGDRVIFEHPTYPLAVDMVRAAGGRPVPVPVSATGVNPQLLAATVATAQPSVSYLQPDHHNPTGAVLKPEARDAVRSAASRGETLLIVDETFADLTFIGTPAPSLLGPGRDHNVVGIGSASKAFWPGLRIGWVRAHPDLVDRLARRRTLQDLGTSVVDQLAVVHLLRNRTSILERRHSELRRRRNLMLSLLETTGWTTNPPAGGLSLWSDLGRPASTQMARYAPRHGLHLVAGTAFGVDGSFDDRLRLTFAEPEEVLREAFTRVWATWKDVEGPYVEPSEPPVI